MARARAGALVTDPAHGGCGARRGDPVLRREEISDALRRNGAFCLRML